MNYINEDFTKGYPFTKDGIDYHKTVFIVDGQVLVGIFDIGVSNDYSTFYRM